MFPMPSIITYTAAGGGGGGSTATWSATNKNGNVLLSNANLTAAADPSGVAFTYIAGRSDTSFTDRRYWESKWDIVETGAGNSGIGIANASMSIANGAYLGSDGNGAGMYDDGGIQIGAGAYFTTITAPSQGDIICIACDAANHLIWFRRNNNNWNDNVSADPASGTGGFNISAIGSTLLPAYSVFFSSVASQTTANFGAGAFSFTVPSGFIALP